MTNPRDAQTAPEFATEWDGDPSGCAICADAEATLYYSGDAICLDCYARRLERIITDRRADTPARAGMGAVKPLVWKRFTEDGMDCWISDGMGQTYEAAVDVDGQAYWGLFRRVDRPMVDASSLEAAKAAAQADYERRILAALQPGEAQGADAVADNAALVDAVARAASCRSPSGDGSRVGEAWYWSERHDHPANETAHEFRNEDRKVAASVLAALSRATPPAAQVTVAEAARVLANAVADYFDGDGGSAALADLDLHALRALAGEA